MKKIIPTIFTLSLASVALVSCGSSKSKDPVTDNKSEATQVYANYFQTINYDRYLNQAAAEELAANSKSYYEIHIPTNTEASKFLNTMDASSYDNKKDKVYVRYASTTKWSSDTYDDIIELLQADTTLAVYADYQTKVDVPADYLTTTTKEDRVLKVVYLPVKVVYVKYSKKKLSSTTISYMLAPVASKITDKANTDYNTYSSIEFKVKNGAMI